MDLHLLTLNALLLQPHVSLATTDTHQFTKSASVCDWNSFKGFVTSPTWGILTDFPISLEFYYIPLRDVMIDLNTFLWDTSLEPLLNATKERHRHSIIRFYIDYPGSSTAVPQFLIDGGLQFNTYADYEGGQSPDYTDANLKNALLHFIAAFGAKYDGDPRIAVIQLGLLGFWGEWHTYPHEEWQWDEIYADDIMNAWHNAFSTTQLNARYASNKSVAYRFGYHDDSFAYATYDASDALKWFFYSQLRNAAATKQWQLNMIGGEIYPDLQWILFTDSYNISQYAQNWNLCVNLTHSTYMLNARAFVSEYDATNGEYDNALSAMRSLGYFIYLDYVSIEIIAYNQINMNINVINDGIAPFYYDLKLIVSIQNVDKGFAQVWDDNSLAADVLSANTNYLLSDILITFEDEDLMQYFGDETSGDFSAVFNISVKLHSSMALEANPIRLCNTETDDTNNSGSITLVNALYLDGNIADDTPITTYTDIETSRNTIDSKPNSAHCEIEIMVATFLTIASNLYMF